MSSYDRRLILTCAAGGAAATLDYIIIAALPVPARLGTLMFFAFGPLIVMGMLGLAAYLELRGQRVSVTLARVFGIAAGVLVNLMAVVQMSGREYFQRFIAEAPDAAAKAALRQQLKGVFTVQLGIDVSWDIFICLATMLFGYGMLRAGGVERWLGAAGIVAGGLLLVFNLATFPVPPGEAGSVDLGPVVGMWFLLAAIHVLIAVRKLPVEAAAGKAAGA